MFSSIRSMLLACAILGSAVCFSRVQAQILPPEATTTTTTTASTVVVGQQISIEGYIVDQFCILNGSFLDTGLSSLEHPDKHTVHCLIDLPQCVQSPYEVLLDPPVPGAAYLRGYTLDETSKATILNIIKLVGLCDSCVGSTGVVQEGFRVRLTATVLDAGGDPSTGAGPTISVTAVEAVLPPAAEQQQFVVGTVLDVEGFVVDEYCINLGYLLDQPTVSTLEMPYMHTLHCLLDEPTCLASNFEILLDPIPMTATEQQMMTTSARNGELQQYRRGFVLDTGSKARVNGLARTIGQCATSCRGSLERGLRIKANVTVLDTGDPTTNTPPTVGISNEQIIQPVYFFKDASSMTQTFNNSLLQVGDRVTVTGYVMDQWCINLGYLLDNPTVATLINPAVHSVHCLIDVAECAASPYEILLDPPPGSPNMTSYTRGFVLDEASKSSVRDLAKWVGDCDTCTGRRLQSGFRVQAKGTIVALGMGAIPPTISVDFIEPILPTVADDFGVTTTLTTNATNMTTSASYGENAEAGPGTGPCTAGSHTMENTPLTFYYEVDRNSSMLRGQVSFVGQGWLGFAVSQTGGMLGSTAIIGMPAQPLTFDNPGFYNLSGRDPAFITLLSTGNYSSGGSIAQNVTHTMLSFDIPFENFAVPGMSIDLLGENKFLMAAGFNNNFTAHRFRDSFSVDLNACGNDVSTDGGENQCSNNIEGAALDGIPVCEPVYAVGQNISVEGFVMDMFCIDQGTLLDPSGIMTLEQPNLHSLHCLLDVPQCNTSTYEILLDPLPGQTMYRRGFLLDDASKVRIATIAREIGICDTCSGEGRLEHGFRVKVTATITAIGNDINATHSTVPTISVVDVTPVFFITDSSAQVDLRVGDLLALEGFVMDNYCLELGYLLDAPNVATLEGPDKHSVHCLVDVEPCRASQYEILLDPAPGFTTYTRGFRFDNSSKEVILDLARKTGKCSTCYGNGQVAKGFRIQARATVQMLGSSAVGRALQAGSIAPTISIESATQVDFVPVATDVLTQPLSPPGTPISTTQTTGPVDCSQYQSSYISPNLPLQMDYVVSGDRFSAQIVYEGLGWVGFAISKSGSMVDSLAIIGLPDEPATQSNPGKYNLAERALSGVTKTEQQTLLDSSIIQNETHTVLKFSKLLQEQDEIPIESSGAENKFLLAAGSSNDLKIHRYREVITLTLAPCTASSGGADSNAITQDSGSTLPKESLLKAHGILAAFAWAILVPVAIGSSLCRHLIPSGGLWFQIHRGVNVSVLVITFLAFFLAVGAVREGHFTSISGALGKHKSIGLVVVLFLIFQVIGGMLRPHLPETDDNFQFKEAKSNPRIAFEIGHRVVGFLLVFLSWYQMQSGLKRYSDLYGAKDRTRIFWGVTFFMVILILIGFGTQFFMDSVDHAKTDRPSADEQPLVETGEEPPQWNDEEPLLELDESRKSHHYDGEDDEQADNRAEESKEKDDVESQLNGFGTTPDQVDDAVKSGTLTLEKDREAADGNGPVENEWHDEDTPILPDSPSGEDAPEINDAADAEDEAPKKKGFRLSNVFFWRKKSIKKESEVNAEELQDDEESPAAEGYGASNEIAATFDDGNKEHSEVKSSGAYDISPLVPDHDEEVQNDVAASNDDEVASVGQEENDLESKESDSNSEREQSEEYIATEDEANFPSPTLEPKQEWDLDDDSSEEEEEPMEEDQNTKKSEQEQEDEVEEEEDYDGARETDAQPEKKGKQEEESWFLNPFGGLS